MQQRVMLILIVDPELDFRDGERIESPPFDQHESRMDFRRIRRFDLSVKWKLRKQHRREERQEGENKAAGNPSPHNPNLQPDCALLFCAATVGAGAQNKSSVLVTQLTITPLEPENQIIDGSLYYGG
jgi:hypothetical protein